MASHIEHQRNFEAPEMATGSRLAFISVIAPLLAAIALLILILLLAQRLG
jgi:hypothetical protein